MTTPDLDIVSIGNALVDVLASTDDDFLARHELVKGTMALVPTEEAASELYAEMGVAVEKSGGSAANTAAGVAGLGGTSGFIGRVRDDQLGEVFAHDLRSAGVVYRAMPAVDGPSTGRSLILVSPDGERTMNTYLGAAALLDSDDIDEPLVASAAVLHLEGYLFDTEPNRAAYRAACAIARGAGRRVSLSTSDVFCVERNRAEWSSLVSDHVDILFANEAEIGSLYETDDLDACIAKVRDDVELAVITRSELGAVIVTGDGALAVPAYPVEQVVDTTGAGDSYAAGFLFGLTHDRSLEDCGLLGALAAAEIIGKTGARPETDLVALARGAGLL